MKIDLQTIKELELLKFDSHGLSIFELFDLTSTPGGKYKLKQNFRDPFNNIKEINATQDTIQHILSEPDKWELPVDGKLMDLLDVYYFSKSKPSISKNIIARFFENISYRFHYKDYKETFIAGTKYALTYLKKVAKFVDTHDVERFPGILTEIFRQITEILKLKPINDGLKVGSIKSVSAVQLLQFDKTFRETHKEQLLKLIDLIYDLDVLISKAHACKKYNLHFPEFIETDNAQFEINGLYHLFLNKPVSNNIEFTENKNFVFLTGPNMAGKTTFLKACGVAVFLAHLGMGVPADSMRLSLFDHLSFAFF